MSQLGDSVPTYVIEGSLVSSFHKRWIKNQHDAICIVGGVDEGGVFRLVEKRSLKVTMRGFQERDQACLKLLNKLLEDMKKDGHTHLAHLHLKPVPGKGGTAAESRHYELQRYLERRGHSAVGVICSSDGFVKPFSGGDRDIRFDVSGDVMKDVSEKEGEPIWQIVR